MVHVKAKKVKYSKEGKNLAKKKHQRKSRQMKIKDWKVRRSRGKEKEDSEKI
jgi:hypothetical protein